MVAEGLIYPMFDISTHAPLAGRDVYVSPDEIAALFQPTRPLRGATLCCLFLLHICKISTHAPLAGRDLLSPCTKYSAI